MEDYIARPEMDEELLEIIVAMASERDGSRTNEQLREYNEYILHNNEVGTDDENRFNIDDIFYTWVKHDENISQT